MTVELDATRVEELGALAVPLWARGVWQRTSIRTGAGGAPAPMTVIWIQTPTLYADIRCPAPGDTATKEEGFAGSLGVDGQVCHWHRPVDLHPGPEGADRGAMFRAGDDLIEVGVLRNYLEEYRLLAPAARSFAASRGAFTIEAGAVRFAPSGTLDILVAAGPYVTHARRHDGASALRHGRFDAAAGAVGFELQVGAGAVFASGGGAWTVWTDEMPERDALLEAAETRSGQRKK